jgi:hypothetical protein
MAEPSLTRAGPRPDVTPTNPQQQLDQQPEDAALQAELAERVFALPNVTEEPSRISVPGARALVLDAEAASGPPASFLIGTEFAHLHPIPDQSLHLCLPPERAAAEVESGWAEYHPFVLRGQIEPTRLLVYAARDHGELEKLTELVVASHAYATAAADT